MSPHTTLLAVTVAASVATPAAALDLTLTGTDAPTTQTTSTYACADGRTVSVTYHNAGPVLLAVVPTPDGNTLVFSRVLSGSGSRYAANQYAWWLKGEDATLHDLTKGPNDEGVLCTATTG